MLNETRLKNKIRAAFSEEKEEKDAAAAMDRIATKLAQAVIEEIKQISIMYNAGLVAPNGPVSGTFNYTIS
ncbi:MAG: hypothetical protein JO154_20565 [Chitinophaga sp.]|uniref:hypothetical protein n=1 Tax=Chitinophaga sp. TaxID=1869181 RepID=UPI0025C1F66A|nr:hypothetical protein [Chitinophaga sp.]MBV8255006.1 hypothetical protein [Chitinophaga sp.]